MSAVSMLNGSHSSKGKSATPLDAMLGQSGGTDFSKFFTGSTEEAPSTLKSNPSNAADWNASKLDKPKENPEKLRETFNEFVGNVVFGQMLSSMRKTVGKTPYMHGGRAEEVFQNQLDQELSKQITESSAAQFADPMFELFQLQRAA